MRAEHRTAIVQKTVNWDEDGPGDYGAEDIACDEDDELCCSYCGLPAKYCLCDMPEVTP